VFDRLLGLTSECLATSKIVKRCRVAARFEGAPPPFNHAGGIRRGIEATTSVNRKDFGLVWNVALETGGLLVGDEITITLEVELLRS
jgi:polyisoprenoid-binding protein YceI